MIRTTTASLAAIAALMVATSGSAQTAGQTMPQTGTAQPGTAQPGTAQPGTATPGAPATGAAPADQAAAPNPTVGGAAMDASKPIPVNAAAAPTLSTLVKAVTAAGLVPTLSGPGPFTVFAPTDDAFGRLAPGTVDTLLKPANKATLTKVLTYHVVPGKITIAQLQAQATAAGGSTTLTTVEGEPLKVTVNNNVIELSDVNGNKSYISTGDVMQSNGVVHVVNGVLLPKLG
ncbi:fasciclin domain-containing protein [Sphingomonas sp. H39-1-10]|uniref:fasciclin domain-containing protein n=1 Tax=Sphingomonas TaxID=13687 RepID=UPI00088BFC69|nr:MULTISPECIES: fasciclin domain-containing protein [Sphingomonas]MDF0489818.1 fasciclin domain-containing protein [Sphingomonas pollutisoli]SDA31758.1 Uncaracterized surface protein containing fasciclin (FAS1) repeats [Sphingomonas sp. NFR15]